MKRALLMGREHPPQHKKTNNYVQLKFTATTSWV